MLELNSLKEQLLLAEMKLSQKKNDAVPGEGQILINSHEKLENDSTEG